MTKFKLTNMYFLLYGIGILLLLFGPLKLMHYRQATRNIAFVKIERNIDQLAQIIRQISTNQSSLYGRRYRSMICTVVRNDPHLLEFILRHLIIGFSHIVLYDDNRIKAGYDTDIKNLIQPFVTAGLVTHIPSSQTTVDLLPNHMKNSQSSDCVTNYGKHTDWIAILDTDEYLYYEKNNQSVNMLNDLLINLEAQNACAITIPWSMMYGEAMVLRQNKTLLETYPRICGVHTLPKVIAKPDSVIFDIPHIVKCNESNRKVVTLQDSDKSNVKLLHYYSKSVEEFLIKADQSIPPYFREIIGSYDLGPKCQLVNVTYTDDYKKAFLNTHRHLISMASFQPKQLQSLPLLAANSLRNYALYIYMKYRCTKRHEFDNEKYLQIHPDAKNSVKNGSLVDGLYHFMENFSKGVRGCWKTDTNTFCE